MSPPRFPGDPSAFYSKLIIEDSDASLLRRLPKPVKTKPDPSVKPRTLPKIKSGKRDFKPSIITDDKVRGPGGSGGSGRPSGPSRPSGADDPRGGGHGGEPSSGDGEPGSGDGEPGSGGGGGGADNADPFDIIDPNLSLMLNEKVGIIGAGIGGLYTALILNSLNIEYEILEASDRVGGRLKTYKFSGGGEYDYYEEGAMRFPLPKKENGQYKNGTMKRLAELTEYGPLNQGPNRLKDQLIPYYFTTRNPDRPGFYYFNGIHHAVGGAQEPSGFGASEMGVSNAYIAAGAGAIHHDAIDPFVNILINDLQNGTKDGWEVMMQNDVYSVRGYLGSKYLPSYPLNLPPTHLSNNIIDWVNLLQSSSGGYDRALTESVFSAFAFANVGDQDFGDVEWKCFRRGSETLSNKIKGFLESQGALGPENFNKRVTAIRQTITTVTITDDGDVIEGAQVYGTTIQYPGVAVTVNTNNGSETKFYDHVISTLPLTVLRTIDLNGAGLNVPQRNALRALDYGPSIKIAVRFRSNWWFTKLGIFGGQSFTDLPIRTIVYPSYGTNAIPSKVLIASYTWTNDASRLGALAVKPDREVLKELVLRNLAKAHYGVRGNFEITYDFLVGELAEGENFHVKDWNIDEYSMGAFANFSPGEFQNLYASLSVPAANGCLHFAGEAISTRHGWVVGALDSAWKSVYEYLKLTGQGQKLELFKELWGENTEWTTNAAVAEGGPVHDELDVHIALSNMAVLAGIF